jgi:glycogen debranching enzyme
MNRRLIQNHLLNKEEFNVQFPIPSLAVNHPSFNPFHSPYLWRGPTWIFYNWFLYHALLRRGFSEHSQLLLNSVKEIISKSGFREYYNPFTGEGYGAIDFTWSGLVVDMIQGKEWI